MSRCFFTEKWRLFHNILPLKRNEFIPKQYNFKRVNCKILVEHTIAFSHMFEFYYTSICFIPMFHLFAISPSQCAPVDSAGQSNNTFLATWPAHKSLIAWLPDLTDNFVLVSIDYCVFVSLIIFEFVYVLICFIPMLSFICNLSISVFATIWLSRAIHQHIYSRLASTQFADCMNWFTLQIFLFLFSTDIYFFAGLFMFEL